MVRAAVMAGGVFLGTGQAGVSVCVAVPLGRRPFSAWTVPWIGFLMQCGATGDEMMGTSSHCLQGQRFAYPKRKNRKQ